MKKFHIRYPYGSRMLCGKRMTDNAAAWRSTANWVDDHRVTCKRCAAISHDEEKTRKLLSKTLKGIS